MNELVGREIGVLLKEIVDSMRGAGTIALGRDAFAVLLEQLDDPDGGVERLVGGVGDAGEKEFEPGLLRPVLAYLL